MCHDYFGVLTGCGVGLRGQGLNPQPRRPLQPDPGVRPRGDRLEEPPLPRRRVEAAALLRRGRQLERVLGVLRGRRPERRMSVTVTQAVAMGETLTGVEVVLEQSEVLDALRAAQRARGAVLLLLVVAVVVEPHPEPDAPVVDLVVAVGAHAHAHAVAMAVAEVVHRVVEGQGRG